MNKLEIRLNELAIDSLTTTETNDDLVVEGYVNETGKWSHQMRSKKGLFIEKIMPGAFNKALNANNDVHFLAEHDSNKILSSTRNNSLTLTEDEKGLKMKAIISKTSYGKDYYQLIKDGILRNMSFGFYPIKDSWTKGVNGILERSISELALFEVSVVTNPAYPASAISARGIDLVEEVEVPDFIEKEERTEQEMNETIAQELRTLISKVEELANEVKELKANKEEPIEETKEEVETKEESTEIEEKVEETIEEKEEERAVDPLESFRNRLNNLKNN